MKNVDLGSILQKIEIGGGSVIEKLQQIRTSQIQMSFL